MGCRVCRARKVKCDERPNGCLNCERLDLDCLKLETASPSVRNAILRSSRTTSSKKRRTYRSCASCRASKTKCDGERPVCFRCKARSTPCVYDAGPKPVWAQELSRSSVPSESDSREELDPVDETPLSASSENPKGPKEQSTTLPRAGPSRGSPTMPFSPSAGSFAGSNPPSNLPHIQRDLHSPSWLLSQQLPSTPSVLRQLVEHYFSNIHHLRCFAFVHKPSFMRQLDVGFDSNNDENALIHIVCAHGAKFYALDYSRDVQALPAKFIQLAGNGWAKTAERLVLRDYGRISVPDLMTAVLLYDYQCRLGNYAQALMLSGFTTRMAHALQLNLELSPDRGGSTPSTTYKEARRRLMWACYVLDVWTGSGVNQLTLIHESDMKIQLPCNERSFLLQIPRTMPTLQDSEPSQRAIDGEGMMSAYIRLVAIWKRIARYVKNLDTAKDPWLPDSEFALLDSDLRAWHSGLGPCLDFSLDTIYTRLESSQFNSLALLHCTYHNAMCDLYRICMPELFKIRNAIEFPVEQAGFLEHLKLELLHHARSEAMVIAEAANWGTRFLADSNFPNSAYSSSRIMLYYIAKFLDFYQPHAQNVVEDIIKHVQSNNKALRMMSSMMPLAEALEITTERWLRRVCTSFAQRDATAHIEPSDPADIHSSKPSENPQSSQIQNTPDDVLNPISIYRLARRTIREKPSSDHLSGSFHSGEVRSPLAESISILGEASRQQHHGSNRSQTGTSPWTLVSAQGAVAQPSASTQDPGMMSVQTAEPAVVTRSMLTEAIASEDFTSDLQDLQYYPSWDPEGMSNMNEIGMEDPRLSAWLGLGTW